MSTSPVRAALRFLRFVQRSYTKALNKLAWYEDERYRLNAIGPNVRLGNAQLEGQVAIAESSRLSGSIGVGRFTTIGIRNMLHGQITIGRYCQFGPHVGVYAVDHGLDYLTIYNNHLLFDRELKVTATHKAVEIGHGVWLGHGAIVLSGVHVGNGAVIGAGAVVTKDVGPYEVAVGNPARVVKRRFEGDLAVRLSRWEWWNLAPKELEQYKDAFFINVRQEPQRMADFLSSIGY